jgi:hypothetical protein
MLLDEAYEIMQVAILRARDLEFVWHEVASVSSRYSSPYRKAYKRYWIQDKIKDEAVEQYLNLVRGEK